MRCAGSSAPVALDPEVRRRGDRPRLRRVRGPVAVVHRRVPRGVGRGHRRVRLSPADLDAVAVGIGNPGRAYAARDGFDRAELYPRAAAAASSSSRSLTSSVVTALPTRSRRRGPGPRSPRTPGARHRPEYEEPSRRAPSSLPNRTPTAWSSRARDRLTVNTSGSPTKFHDGPDISVSRPIRAGRACRAADLDRGTSMQECRAARICSARGLLRLLAPPLSFDGEARVTRA